MHLLRHDLPLTHGDLERLEQFLLCREGLFSLDEAGKLFDHINLIRERVNPRLSR